MSPVTISSTRQDFDGQRYWRGGKYFMRLGKHLHRAVWEKTYGPVPEGYHIHHINHDRDDNRLENLSCLPARVHKQQHADAVSFVETMTRKVLLQCRECGDLYACTTSRATVSCACSSTCYARLRRKRLSKQYD